MSDETKKQDIKPEEKEEMASLDLQIKRAQLEQMKLEKQEREYSIKDLKQRLADRELRETQVQEDRAAQGRAIAQQEYADISRQSVCTHKKGGTANARDIRVLSTGGNGNQYAVMKHQMMNGDIWVRCLRCGKTWSPPVASQFYFRDGKIVPEKFGTFDKEKYEAAFKEYRLATQFETNNTMSGSVQCRFSRYNKETERWEDASDVVRENLQHTTLR